MHCFKGEMKALKEMSLHPAPDMSAVTVYGTHYTYSEHLAPCPAVSAVRLYYFRSLSMVRSIVVYIGRARRRRYDTQMEHEGTHSDSMYPTQTHTYGHSCHRRRVTADSLGWLREECFSEICLVSFLSFKFTYSTPSHLSCGNCGFLR